jgi:hypothetical protein
MASNTIPPTWNRKPARLKSISPKLARPTPATMNMMLRKRLSEGSSTPQAQAVSSTATGAAALSIWIKATLRYRYTMLLHTRLALYTRPMGTMARK